MPAGHAPSRPRPVRAKLLALGDFGALAASPGRPLRCVRLCLRPQAGLHPPPRNPPSPVPAGSPSLNPLSILHLGSQTACGTCFSWTRARSCPNTLQAALEAARNPPSGLTPILLALGHPEQAGSPILNLPSTLLALVFSASGKSHSTTTLHPSSLGSGARWQVPSRVCPPGRRTRRTEKEEARWWWDVCLLARVQAARTRVAVTASRRSRCPCIPAGAERTFGARRRARTCRPRSGGGRRSGRRSAWARRAIPARRGGAHPRCRRRRSPRPSLREEGREGEGIGSWEGCLPSEERVLPPHHPLALPHQTQPLLSDT